LYLLLGSNHHGESSGVLGCVCISVSKDLYFVALMEADAHIMSLSDPLFSSQLASDASVCSTMTKKVVKLLDQFDPAYATPLEARLEAMVQLGLASGATFDDEACLSAHFYTP
jgi:hypothetical protein